MKTSRAVIFSLAVIGCAAEVGQLRRDPPATEISRPAQPVRLWVGVEAWSRFGGGRPRWDAVRQGQVMHSGDRISLHVRVDEPAYVAIFYIGTNGKIQLLHTTPGRIQPGHEMRVPPLPQMLELDQNLGEENLIVLARREQALSQDESLGAIQKAVDRGLLKCKESDNAPVGTAGSALTKLSCGSLGSEQPKTVVAAVRPSRAPRALGPKAASPMPKDGTLLPPGFEQTMGFFTTTGAQVQVDEAEKLSLFRFRLEHAK